jgi:hypothetical protein
MLEVCTYNAKLNAVRDSLRKHRDELIAARLKAEALTSHVLSEECAARSDLADLVPCRPKLFAAPLDKPAAL